MPPLYFDPESADIVDVPRDTVQLPPNVDRLLPLAQLLVSQDFPYTPGDFPVRKASQWSEEEVKHIGMLVAKDLADEYPAQDFTQDIGERLRTIGLFPSRSYFFQVQKHFDGWANFKKEIGVDPFLDRNSSSRNAEYDQLSIDELTDLLLQRYNNLIKYSQEKRYPGPLNSMIIEALNSMDLGPGRKYFERRFGGLRKVNDHLGFPDIHSWDEHDYITYGAAVLRHNGPNSISQANIKLLSAHKFGPDWQAIMVRFNAEDFKTKAQEELQRQLLTEEQHQQAVYAHYKQHGPSDANMKDINFSQMARHRALYLIAARYLNGQTPTFPPLITNECVSDTIAVVLRQYPRLTLADVETTAVAMDIFDDLWPTHHPQRLPILANCKRK